MAEDYDRGAMELAEQVRVQERRETLGMLMALRFGELPPEAQARIEQAGATALDAAFARLDSANRWQDLFE